jgi:hypothetical protein
MEHLSTKSKNELAAAGDRRPQSGSGGSSKETGSNANRDE